MEINQTTVLFVIGQIGAGAITYGVLKTEFKFLRRDLEKLTAELERHRHIIDRHIFKISD